MNTHKVLTVVLGLGLALGPRTALKAQGKEAAMEAEIQALKERLAALERELKGKSASSTEAPAKSEAAGGGSEKPAQAPAPTAAPGNGNGAGLEFSALVDSYYSLNFNHPASGGNQLRNFDTHANQFSLNMVKLTLAKAADPVGFRVDLGLGPAFEIIHASEPGGLGPMRYIQQAYLTYNAPVGKGLTIDIGKFVTQHGAEVIETTSNWNYSRSLLFAYAIPYYHFGARATYPLHKTFTGGFVLANGWNNVVDNNSGKTYAFQGIWTPNSHFTWTNNYMFGPEKTGTNEGYRHLWDTTATITVNPRAAFMVNYDYGIDRIPGGGKNRWTGVAGYARLSPNKWFAFIPRVEWFNDADGFTTGLVQKLKEATLTAEFKVRDDLLTRLEYRRDWSDQRFFDRGNTPASGRSQDTLLAGFVVSFAPKR